MLRYSAYSAPRIVNREGGARLVKKAATAVCWGQDADP
jgi:hypothetical protein